MKYKMLIAALFLASGLQGEETLLFQDDFRDGNLKDNTVWKSKSASSPWQVTASRATATGKIAFDSLSTSDFKAIANGAFDLRFTIVFASDAKTGDNRFSVYLRDSANGNNGYGATIAQGTSNNSGLEKIDSGKTTMLCQLPPAKAFYFSPDKATEIRLRREPSGLLELSIDGNPVLKATDSAFSRFDCLQFTLRCKNPEMIQSIGAVSLSNSSNIK